MPHNGFVMVVRLRNTGAAPMSGVQAFSIHNFHLGFGRPGVMENIGNQGETIGYDEAKKDFLERAFAGVVVGRALAPVAHHAAWSSTSGQSGFDLVDKGGAVDLPDLTGEAPVGDNSVSAFQQTLGDLAPGAEAWAGVAFAHHGDPFAGATVQGWLDTYVAGQGAKALYDAEVASWASFQQGLVLPPGMSADEETLFRHSAAMLHMGQSHEEETYLREVLSTDGEPRYTHFAKAGETAPATLPATVKHRGKGAILASLPPGEWTVSWARDSAYAIVAMATAGMKTEARDALNYYLTADSGRFQGWNELKPYSMPPYQISLVRYHGFGVEETDFNEFGPNLEFDGFGLMLWALAHYEARSKDTTLVTEAWPIIAGKIGDALVALVDPATGLIRKDSSIWETHWNGRERSWAYTSLTAARGLCDASTLAARVGDTARATSYRQAGLALRQAIATKLLDKQRVLASNLEEIESGEGYLDASAIDAVAMELFDPKGTVAKATLAAFDAGLSVGAGAGWSRNDDRYDHAGKTDLSPWGGYYDSAEWVVTDLRGAVANELGGDAARALQLVSWTTKQAHANYLEVSETYDEVVGTYKFNSPMMGFGAGAYLLALEARNAAPDPACGAYFDESTLPPIEPVGPGGAGGQAGSGGSSGQAGQSTGGAGSPAGQGGTDAGAAGDGAGGVSAGGAGAGGSVGGSPATGGAGAGGAGAGTSGAGGKSGSAGGGAAGSSGQAG
ncbi:MAG: glycosyl hydrolase, partial [Myxococcales bacterium]